MKLKQTSPFAIFSGLLLGSLILCLFLLTLFALFAYAKPNNDSVISLASFIDPYLNDSYLLHVIRFSLYQAFLSTLLAVVPAVFVAKALFQQRFWGRTLLLKLMGMTLVLPALVVVFGLITLYGRNGWLVNGLEALFNTKIEFSIYGLPAILLAHVFFNLPFASRVLLQRLEHIPSEQYKLAAQLDLQGLSRFYFIEWPFLWRQMISLSALVFTLCFASFSIVLTLGGGPKATTIEVAIYQALTYDYDFTRGALLGLLQILFCLTFVFIAQKLGNIFPNSSASSYSSWQDKQVAKRAKKYDLFVITSFALILLPPLFAVVYSGINLDLYKTLSNNNLWQATKNSLLIGIGAGILALLFSTMLILAAREWVLVNKIKRANVLLLTGSISLAMPSLVLATGIFLLFNYLQLQRTFWASPYILVTLINALMAMPFVINLLNSPLTESARNYHKLCANLGLSGISRFRWIEWRALQVEYRRAFGFAMTLSLGDVGVMALFGSQHQGEPFLTLPFYLYQQLGSYRGNQADVTALFLLILTFILFWIIEKTPSLKRRSAE